MPNADIENQLQTEGLSQLQGWIERTFAFRDEMGSVELPLGFFTNVISVGRNMGIAFATDGVGTKILVAQRMHKWDTVGIDCVAMNVNDILCVGADPLAMVDYIAVQESDPVILGELAKGLCAGAEMAQISIPGGEVARVPEMLRGHDGAVAFDLVGSCIGVLPLNRILVGQDISDGDVVVGLRSSGVHSNGFTLVRRIFFDQLGWEHDRDVDELGRTIGEELLEPTRIYVREVLQMLDEGLSIKALAHITGDGMLNLKRFQSDASFLLESWPQPQPIFRLIQSLGNISDEQMYREFNMGIGFCIVVAAGDVDRVLAIAEDHGVESFALGTTVMDDQKKVVLPNLGLVY